MSKKNRKPFSNPAPILQSENSSIQTSKNLDFVYIGVLLLFVGIAFIDAFNNQFVEWDDQIYIKQNPIIQDAGLHQLGKIFSTSVALNYHPITILSLMLNALFFGKGATSFIVTNVLVHAINTILVFLFIQKLTNKQPIISFFTAFLFAVHPLRVESVVWVSERKDVLYTCFFFAGCLTYINFLKNSQRKSLIYTYLFFVLACLSKAQAVVFPLILMLIDYWFNNDAFSTNRIKQKIPFLVIAFFFGLIALNIQSGGNFGGLIQPIMPDMSAIEISYNFFDKLQIGTYGFIAYLWKMILPLDLSPLYPYIKEADGSTPASYKLGLILFPLIIGLAIWAYKRYKIIAFGVFFYLICIVLVLQFLSVGVAVMADRYSYLPFVGIFFLIAYGANKLTESIPKYVVWGVLAAFGLWCTYLTTKQVKVWKDTIALFSQRININPNDSRALDVRGQMYLQNQQNELGIADLEKAISLGVKNEVTFMALGNAYGNGGNKPKAAEIFTKVIELNPKNAEAFANRASTNFPTAQAIPDYEKAISIMPNADWLAYLGACYANSGDVRKGLDKLNQAIGLQKNPQTGHFLNRAIMFSQLGDKASAIKDLKQILATDANNQQAQQMLKGLGQ